MSDPVSSPTTLSKDAADMLARRPFISWPTALATLTFLVGVATILLQLLGFVIHRTYLSAWGLSADQFPKAVDWLLINGYYGVWNGTAMLFVGFFKNLAWVGLSAVALALYIKLLLSSWNPFPANGKSPVWLTKLPKWGRALASLVASSIGIMLLILFLLSLVFTLIGIPAKTGRAIGQEYVDSQTKDFDRGCEASRTSCIEIRRGETLLGVGYMLDISPTHLAYVDASMNLARVVPRDDLEIRSTRPAKHRTFAAD